MRNYIDRNGLRSIPSAIFAVNDETAFGVSEVLSKEGLKIPNEVSAIGYDDIYIADYIGLTTILQEKYKMGEIVALELLTSIEKEGYDIIKQLLIEPKLIIRKSCAKRQQ